MSPACFVCGYVIGNRAHTTLAQGVAHTPGCYAEALRVAQAALKTRYPAFRAGDLPRPVRVEVTAETPVPTQRELGI